ncbi:hypothetical protein DL770_010003 [Monosporascus sp. CRB-9-2]|nr:hypothetical protein DL770_010003 [Monosporascus sp. CRB-9-2]
MPLRHQSNRSPRRSNGHWSGNEICGTKLAGWHYLRACIGEMLRMSPPVPGVPPDLSTHNQARWLASADSKSRAAAAAARKAMHDAFAAFSVGARRCAGKPLASLEANLALLKTFWYFDFEVAPSKLGDVGMGRKGEFRLYHIFTSTHDGPYLAFNSRI